MTKSELENIVRPHTKWKETTTREEEEAAKSALVLLTSALNRVRPIPCQTPGTKNAVDYLIGLEYIYFELSTGHYRDACNETQKYINRRSITQPEILAGLRYLLNSIENKSQKVAGSVRMHWNHETGASE